VYTIQTKYRKQIADLRKQIVALQDQQKKEMIQVLTKEQRDQLAAEFKDEKKDKPVKDKLQKDK
jgi:hypothetical protein